MQIVSTGKNELRGTYIHLHSAINLAQWLSPKFAVALAKWVFDWMQGNVQHQKMPYHLRRYVSNMHKIPPTNFSMLNELTIRLIAPMEAAGYTLPDKIIPHILEGRMFCDWLRNEKGLEPKNFQKYEHRYEDGRTVQVNLYPNSILYNFINHFNQV